MDFDYEKEKQVVKEKLESGKFNIEVLENNGPDYKEHEMEDVAAFEKHLDSEESEALSAWVLKK